MEFEVLKRVWPLHSFVCVYVLFTKVSEQSNVSCFNNLYFVILVNQISIDFGVSG